MEEKKTIQDAVRLHQLQLQRSVGLRSPKPSPSTSQNQSPSASPAPSRSPSPSTMASPSLLLETQYDALNQPSDNLLALSGFLSDLDASLTNLIKTVNDPKKEENEKRFLQYILKFKEAILQSKPKESSRNAFHKPSSKPFAIEDLPELVFQKEDNKEWFTHPIFSNSEVLRNFLNNYFSLDCPPFANLKTWVACSRTMINLVRKHEKNLQERQVKLEAQLVFDTFQEVILEGKLIATFFEKIKKLLPFVFKRYKALFDEIKAYFEGIMVEVDNKITADIQQSWIQLLDKERKLLEELYQSECILKNEQGALSTLRVKISKIKTRQKALIEENLSLFFPEINKASIEARTQVVYPKKSGNPVLPLPAYEFMIDNAILKMELSDLGGIRYEYDIEKNQFTVVVNFLVFDDAGEITFTVPLYTLAYPLDYPDKNIHILERWFGNKQVAPLQVAIFDKICPGISRENWLIRGNLRPIDNFEAIKKELSQLMQDKLKSKWMKCIQQIKQKAGSGLSKSQPVTVPIITSQPTSPPVQDVLKKIEEFNKLYHLLENLCRLCFGSNFLLGAEFELFRNESLAKNGPIILEKIRNAESYFNDAQSFIHFLDSSAVPIQNAAVFFENPEMQLIPSSLENAVMQLEDYKDAFGFRHQKLLERKEGSRELPLIPGFQRAKERVAATPSPISRSSSKPGFPFLKE